MRILRSLPSQTGILCNTALLVQIPESPAAAHGHRAPRASTSSSVRFKPARATYVIKLLEGVQIEQPDGLTIVR
ncbi:MAG: hypothetical protein QOE74_1005 [Mycobacterium sp.]|jgi:hypothetical protein|nr:hypothetical protein [Mycobacterium sp.]